MTALGKTIQLLPDTCRLACLSCKFPWRTWPKLELYAYHLSLEPFKIHFPTNIIKDKNLLIVWWFSSFLMI